MVKLIRFLGVLLLVMSCGSLAGCANPAVLWDASVEDAAGVWVPRVHGVDSKARLLIKADGTFSATEWPRNLACVGQQSSDGETWEPATKPEEIDWDQTLSFEGEWTRQENYRVYLDGLQTPCSAEPQLWVDHDANDALQLRFLLNGLQDEWNFIYFEKMQ